MTKNFFHYFLFLFLLIPCLLLAEQAPEQVVKEMIAKVKAGNELAVLDYVHWDSTFEGIGDQQKSAIGVKSSAELKTFVSGIIKDPVKFVDVMIDKQLAIMPDEQRKVFEPMVRSQMSGIKEKIAEKKDGITDKIKNASVDIDKARITGNKALVTVKTTVAGQPMTQDLNMRKVANKWYLSLEDLEKGGLF